MIRVFATLLFLLLLGNVFTGVLQDYFIFRFSPLPADYVFTPDHPIEEIVLPRQDGTLHGFFFPKENAKGVVLFFHGNRGNVERWSEVADRFLKRGYSVFIPDYRGYGKSTGKRSEKIFFDDAVACFALLRERFPHDRIIVYGRSIGSAAASYVAANADCQGLILETPFFSMKDLFYTYYPFLPRMFYFKYAFENHAFVDQAKCKVSIIAGDDDGVVPLRCAIKLRAHLKADDKMVVVKDGSHNDLSTFPEYGQFLDDALAN